MKKTTRFIQYSIIMVNRGYDIGDTVTVVFQSDEHTKCGCMLKSRKQCNSKHKFYYVSSNDDREIVCGRVNHREKILERMCENGSLVVGIFEKVSENQIQNNAINVTYKVIGTNVSKDNDIVCPLVMNTMDPKEMRQTLKHKINETQTVVADINNEINNLYTKIGKHRKRLVKYHRIRSEYHSAISYMRENTEFNPSTSGIKRDVSKDMCAICFDQCCDGESTTLECNHSFHNHCIKQWFGNKTEITCPCCRHVCDTDRYFRYTKYRPPTAEL